MKAVCLNETCGKSFDVPAKVKLRNLPLLVCPHCKAKGSPPKGGWKWVYSK
jgi:hypothetical protein